MSATFTTLACGHVVELAIDGGEGPCPCAIISDARRAVENDTAEERTYPDGSRATYSFFFHTWLVFEPKAGRS